MYGAFIRFLFKSLLNFELTSCAVMGFSEEMLKSGGLLPRPLLSYTNALPCRLTQLKNVLLSVHSLRDVPDPFWNMIVPLNSDLGFGKYSEYKIVPSISVNSAWA